MKHILTLILILIAESLSAQIQHPTLLSMQGLNGNDYDQIHTRSLN